MLILCITRKITKTQSITESKEMRVAVREQTSTPFAPSLCSSRSVPQSYKLGPRRTTSNQSENQLFYPLPRFINEMEHLDNSKCRSQMRLRRLIYSQYCLSSAAGPAKKCSLTKIYTNARYLRVGACLACTAELWQARNIARACVDERTANKTLIYCFKL